MKAHITVTVPALTLIGHTNEPADLEGYGPIDADTARALAGGSPFWHRMLTHPHSGIPLAYDRATYRPPADLAQWIKHRDTTCRAPGCTIPASRCDIDHTVAWQHGGGTNVDNLANLCRRHHTLKHHTGWTPTNHGDGRLTWTSPHRQRHAVAPEPTAANTDLPPPF